MTLDEAMGERWDALSLPGDALIADKLRVEPSAQELVPRFDREKKMISPPRASCAAAR